MNSEFAAFIGGLPEKYEKLMAMPGFTMDALPRDTPEGGVYLFTENGQHLYVGRTKKTIRDRVREHVAKKIDCPLALRLARESTNNMTPTYKPKGSAKDLLKQPNFQKAYEQAQQRIRSMEVRYVGESHPIKQALLEIYVAVAIGAKYNVFDTH